MEFELSNSDVNPDLPLIYLWEVLDDGGRAVYRYVGKASGGAKRPVEDYRKNVNNLLNGRPYRRGDPEGFRHVHRMLADGVRSGRRIRLTLLVNVAPGERINDVERQWQVQLGCSPPETRQSDRPREGGSGGRKHRAGGLTRAQLRTPAQQSEKHVIIWNSMGRLELAGLGTRVEQSDQRIKFLLDPLHPRALDLTQRPQSRGFIRADAGSLLFRAATPEFVSKVPTELRMRAMPPKKGLEFRWTALSNDEVRELMALVENIAAE